VNVNCTAAHTKHQKFRAADTRHQEPEQTNCQSVLLQKANCCSEKMMLRKSVLLQTKLQTHSTDVHEIQTECSIAHCNNVKLPCTTNVQKRDTSFTTAANIANANLTALDIVVHHISDAATLRIANSARHFDSQFQPQESRSTSPCPSTEIHIANCLSFRSQSTWLHPPDLLTLYKPPHLLL